MPNIKAMKDIITSEKLDIFMLQETKANEKEMETMIQKTKIIKDKVAKCGPIWAIIDERWKNQLHRPIHAAGYFLNPRYHYKAKTTGALKGGG